MAEAQLRQFLDKVRQLNAFVALTEADPQLRLELRDCEHHDQVVALARRCGFEIGRRWGELPAAGPGAAPGSEMGDAPQSVGQSADSALPWDKVQTCQSEAACEPGLAAAPVMAPLCAAGGETSAASQDGGDLSPSHQQAAVCAAMGDRPVLPAAEVGRTGGATGKLLSLISRACPPPGEELSEVLIKTPQWRLERIHSCSSRSPDGFWYEQQEHEWVLLLQGTARLRCADQPSDLELGPGDSLWLKAGRRHRVTATDPAPGTIWLALFWRAA